MEDTIIVPGTDTAVEPASTEVQIPVQTASELQVPDVTKVEGNDNKPQVTEPQRKQKPSDFYREREKFRRLEETQKLTQKRLDEIAEFLKPKPEIQSEQPFDKDKFFLDPEPTFKNREQKLLAEISLIKQELLGLKNQTVNNEKMSAEREALEMLFPKSSPDANETLEQRLENEERKEALENLFKANPGLDRLMRIAPKEAAELALLKLGSVKPQTSPNAIKKSLMSGQIRGNPMGGTKMQNTVESKVAELKALNEQAKEKPQLRFDEDFNKRKTDLNLEINRLLKEERK